MGIRRREAEERQGARPGRHLDVHGADSKLLFSWLLGERSKYATRAFIRDMASRLSGRVQLTTDGLKWYEPAVRGAFGNEIDYGQIVKSYGTEVGPEASLAARRYSPAVCTGAKRWAVIGAPRVEYISTSFVERNNLSIRQGMKRMARLTLGFSKKEENHHFAFALHAMYFNYCRPHGTLSKAAGKPTTPAMAAGLAKKPWTVEQIVQRIDAIFVL